MDLILNQLILRIALKMEVILLPDLLNLYSPKCMFSCFRKYVLVCGVFNGTNELKSSLFDIRDAVQFSASNFKS